MAARQRLAPEVRRRQITEAAAALLLQHGHFPLPMEALAQGAGVSKGLVYGYFPTQWDLANAILAIEIEALASAEFGAAFGTEGLVERAQTCVDIYLRHIAARGPVIPYILRDALMAGHLDAGAAAWRDRILRSFSRLVRRELRLPAAEAVATVVMVIAIPEEMGRLVWQGELGLDRAREMAAQLVASSVAALKPA